jgi:DNA repair protein RecO (recombination protein O)
MRDVNTYGLVLYSQNYREKDKLVKIFTESFGKRMFFVKNFAKSKFASSLQNFSNMNLLATINDEGFSFIDDMSEVTFYRNISTDIFANAYTSYILSLADAAVPDAHEDPLLYGFIKQSLDLIDNGFDKEIITNIFELQILNRFGIQLNFAECILCHRTNVPLDFSYKYSACLCHNHFSQDPRRLHLDPNVLYFAHLFQEISLEKLKTISVKLEMKQKLRLFIDGIYEEYVGVHTKAKQFLEGMGEWSEIMK